MSSFDETTGRITGQLQAFNKLKDSNLTIPSVKFIKYAQLK